MSRLIEQRAVLDRLLAAVAAVPPGVKISIPQLRDHLVSQADVLAGLEMLVAEGALERESLRPPAAAAAHSTVSAVTQDGRPCRRTSSPRAEGERPVVVTGGPQGVEPVRPAAPTGVALAAALDVLIAQHGLSKSHVGTRLLGNTNGVEMLRRSNPRRKTVDKVRAFLSNPPVDELRRMRAPAGDRRFAANKPARAARSSELMPPPPCVTGAELAAELDALIARHGLSKTKVGLKLTGCKGGVEILRARKSLTPLMADRVRALLADPPLAELRRAPTVATLSARPSTPTVASGRDPTQPPAPPLLDLAERQRLNGARHVAAIRRSQEVRATELVDAGADPKTQNPMVAAQMAAVVRRREAEERQANPVEQAKLALQRKGRVVYSASVSGGRKDRFIVSGQQKELTPAELLDLAERVTGVSFRRPAAGAAGLECGAAAAAQKGATA